MDSVSPLLQLIVYGCASDDYLNLRRKVLLDLILDILELQQHGVARQLPSRVQALHLGTVAMIAQATKFDQLDREILLLHSHRNFLLDILSDAPQPPRSQRQRKARRSK